jgi:transcriptional regulator with XRE-family HTH domain
MSTENAEQIPQGAGFPELSKLGKRIELLRIERGLSKQRLARAAGTSRQQLWRVMTGKSELTAALCHRLAEVLQVDPRSLRDGTVEARSHGLTVIRASDPATPPVDAAPVELSEWVADNARLRRTLDTLPVGEPGARLRRELLNCVEDIARESDVRLPGSFFELRGRVINGEL